MRIKLRWWMNKYEIDCAVLLALKQLGGEASRVDIYRRFQEIAGRQITYASLYDSFERLEDAEIVEHYASSTERYALSRYPKNMIRLRDAHRVS